MANPAFILTLIHSCQIEPTGTQQDTLKNPIATIGSLGASTRTRKVTVKADDKQVIAGVVYDSTHKFYFETLVGKVTDTIIEGGKRYRVCHIEEFPDLTGTHHFEFYAKEEGPPV